jgi:2-polyprenyl-3-methyl-5-hydroxy-6-metoxy-1,4-benzoquinol methylase
MEDNQPQYWDSVWSRPQNREADIQLFNKRETSVLWSNMKEEICKVYGRENLNGLSSIEIGAGAGEFSAVMAKNSIDVTLLDYSPLSKIRAEAYFKNNSLSFKEHISCNALKLDATLKGKYDIACSFGVAEHFKGEERLQMLKSHAELLKPGGIFFISVPNKLNLPYITYKGIMEFLGKWEVEEYPYSPMELSKSLRKVGIKNVDFFGDSFRSSFKWLYFIPAQLEQKININFFTKLSEQNNKKFKKSIFDKYFSYALVAFGKNERD